MPFTATTVNSAAAWRPDLYEFDPADALPEALILQCTTQAGSVEGDAKDTENDTGVKWSQVQILSARPGPVYRL